MPWTIRNLSAADGFVPISIQDAAAYGTFNSTAANDPDNPYQWRPNRADAGDLQRARVQRLRGPPALVGDAVDYAKAHPDSIPKAFFWNGLSRFGTCAGPRRIDEIAPNGQSRGVAITGLVLYWVALGSRSGACGCSGAARRSSSRSC